MINAKTKKYNLFIVGHSHAAMMVRLVKDLGDKFPVEVAGSQICFAKFLLVVRGDYAPHLVKCEGRESLNPLLKSDIQEFLNPNHTESASIMTFGQYEPDEQDIVVSLIGGNVHNILGIIDHATPFDFCVSAEPDLSLEEDREILAEASIFDALERRSKPHLAVLDEVVRLSRRSKLPVIQVGSPPVLKDSKYIADNLPAALRPDDGTMTVTPAIIRYKLRLVASRVYREHCSKLGISYIDPPSVSLQDQKFLKQEFCKRNDAIHANSEYAFEVLKLIFAGDYDEMSVSGIAEHPYSNLPNSAFWKRAVAGPIKNNVDPVLNFPFRIGKSDKIVTAGRFFAQHIARYLANSGYNYFVPEQPHSFMSKTEADRLQYDVFSARYANIYTVRQLVQLFDRAFGHFEPVEPNWVHGNGFVDAFRPTIQPEGFNSLEELESSRDIHLKAVRRAFCEADVFVFTLGLTETFEDQRDGAVYPVCPGTSGGQFNPKNHLFRNFNVEDNIVDLELFVSKIRELNPNIKIILTVSPVPLIATASGQNVLVATTYSKSVLRVAAQTVADRHAFVGYFPSFEIITGNHAKGSYFENDLRSVKEEGVNHVMKLFFQHATEQTTETSDQSIAESALESEEINPLDVFCEEEMLEVFLK